MKTPRITPEEVGIIKRAQAGDESAFNALFHRYKGFVDNLLFQYIKDMDEAKDVTNIVFLKVHDKLSLFTEYESFGGWLRILTNRTAIDYLREMKNKSTVLGDSDSRLPSDESSSSSEDDLVNRITYEQILAEFEKFPETTCKALKLFYANNMTVEQISEKLNVPTGTIKSMLSRTRRKIKKKLKI
jgi:RNA polymerase sigma-70 factor (ECF subfamily)